MSFSRIFVVMGRLIAVLLCGGLLGVSAEARSLFTVSPTRVVLTARATSALLTLKNRGSESLRFQLSVVRWQQSLSGEMLLTPTDDIIFFPQLVELRPGEERKIRVGTTTAFGTTERAYRIFVEELPAMVAVGQAPATGVSMRTRMGIPIFLAPAKPTAIGALSLPSTTQRRVELRLDNKGTANFIVDTIRVIGQAANGGETFNKVVNGWYVLAGEAQAFEFPLTEQECRTTATIMAEGKIGEKTLRSQSALNLAGCAPDK